MSGFLTKNAVLFDLTSLLARPSRSGAQRAVFELMRHWPKGKIAVPVLVDENSTMHMISFEVLQAIGSLFRHADEDRLPALSQEIMSFIDRRLETITDTQIDDCDGIFLPGAPFGKPHLDFYDRMSSARPQKIYALFEGTSSGLSTGEPLVCAEREQDGYGDLLRRLENVWFVSSRARRDFETRTAKRTLRNPVVVGGGSDTFGEIACTPDRRRSEFVCVGTIAPDSSHMLVLDVFEAMWRSGHSVRLTFVGEANAIGAEGVRRLEALCSDQPLFSWERCVSDAEMREILRYATTMMCLEQANGLDTSLLEGLHAGIPAIVSWDLDALDFCSSGGVLAVDITLDSLTAAVRSFLDPGFAETKCQEIDRGALSTWADTTREIVRWIYGASEKSAPSALAASLLAGFDERFETARRIDRLVRQDGPAFIDACFMELLGRRAQGSEMAALSGVGERLSSDKLDLILFMASSEDFLRTCGAKELQKWTSGLLFYRSHPGFLYDAMDGEQPGRDGGAGQAIGGEKLDPDLEGCLDMYRALLETDDQNFVERCFNTLLDRPADENSRKGYMDWLATRHDQEESRKLIIREIATSPGNQQRKPRQWLTYMDELAEIDVFDMKQVMLHKELRRTAPSRWLFAMLMSLDDAAFIRFALRLDFGPRDEDIKPLVLVPEQAMGLAVKAKYLLYLATLSKKGRLTNGMKNWLGRIAFS